MRQDRSTPIIETAEEPTGCGPQKASGKRRWPSLRATISRSSRRIQRKPQHDRSSFIEAKCFSRFTLRTHNEWAGKIDRLGEPFLAAQFDQPVALHLG